MIINSVSAQNILKYKNLDLPNMPAQGIIAISGQNESGKSSIGEAVCFALFGRTFSLSPEDIGKILLWGENHCSVTLDFTANEDRYVLSRYLDKDGNHSAKLSLHDQVDKPLARGTDAVADALFSIIGYDFEEFIESFYLAQREITTPHPHSAAIKTMAGIATLEHASIEFEEEINQQQEILEELQAEQEALQTELEEMNFEEGYLISLEDQKNEHEAELLANRDTLSALDQATDNYLINEPAIRRAGKKRGSSRFWRFITFVLSLVLGGAWGLLTQRPDLTQSTQLLNLLQQKIPNWQDAYIPYIGYAAIGMAVIMLLFWIRSASQSSRLKALRKSSAELAPVMEQARAVTPAPLVFDEPPEEDPVESEDEIAEQPNDITMRPMLTDDRHDAAEYAALLSRVESTSATGADVRQYAEHEQNWLATQVQSKEERLWAVSRTVDEELDRVKHVARLYEVDTALQEKMSELEERIAGRENAIELLSGAAEHLSNNFNRDIRDLVGCTLPVFTHGRYEHLRIDPDLTVRVFSSDKRDFMDLEEVSSGTQRQIMLALRLALSQKLLNRTVKGKQFAFLDEPFAFFDEDRTKHALAALDKLSDNLSQVWIVAQAFPAGSEANFAARIECSRDLDALTFTTM
jgi:exonuclease SbcC